MKAIITKILLFFRDLFVHLHVVVRLHIGRTQVGKENMCNDEDIARKDDTND